MRALILGALAALAPLAAMADPRGCPPGLAKKNPACMPPGQARKHAYRDETWRGRSIDDRYSRLRAPGRYHLDPRHSYYVRDDGYVVRVDPETRKVLDLIGAIDALVN